MLSREATFGAVTGASSSRGSNGNDESGTATTKPSLFYQDVNGYRVRFVVYYIFFFTSH